MNISTDDQQVIDNKNLSAAMECMYWRTQYEHQLALTNFYKQQLDLLQTTGLAYHDIDDGK